MKQIEHLFILFDTYATATGRSETTISRDSLNGGGRIGEIRAGKDIGVRRIGRAIQWFSDNWINGAEWPSHIERPLPSHQQVSPRFTRANGDVGEGGADTASSPANFNAQMAEVG